MRKTVVELVMPSLALHEAMRINDPEYYQKDTEKFPLFLMLSGFGEDKDSWLIQGNLMNLCEKYRIAAVSIGGEDKWYLDSTPIDNWHTLLEQELPDFLYGQFAKLDSSRKPIICGVSMGGFGALWNGMTNPQAYSGIISMSPATRADGYMNDESRFPSLKTLFLNTKGTLPYVALSIGENDFIIEPTRQLDAWLEENQIGIRYRFVPDYPHSWDFWREEIEYVLTDMKNRHII